MKDNTKVSRSAIAMAAAVSVGLLSGCSNSAIGGGGSGGGSDTVTVGLLGALSGPYASIGEDQVQGFQLYLDQKDGKLGGREVEVKETDEGATPESAVAAVRRLILQEDADVIVGVTSSAAALATKSLFVEEQVPALVSTAGATEITSGTPSPYLWRTALSNEQTGASLGEHLAKELGDDGVYILAPDYAAGQETADAFKEAFTAAGGTIAGEGYPPFGSTQDYQPYLARAKKSGAKAVWAFFAGAEAVTFVRQYEEFGLSADVRLYGGGTLTDGAVLDAQGDAALGVETSLNYSNLLDNPANVEFVEAYSAAYDEQPTGYAMQAYDAALILDKALEEIDGTAGAEEIAEAIGQVGEVESPRGTFRLGADHNPEQTFYLRRVEPVDGALGNVVVQDLGVFGSSD